MNNGLNRIVSQLFEGITFGLKIIKHLLVKDGNKNNWSQNSPRSKINSRGENVKKLSMKNVQWWSINFYFLWKFFDIGIIVSFPQAKGIYLAYHFTQGTDEHSCETLQCLDVYVYECIKSIEIELVNENRCLNWNLKDITWTNVTFCKENTILIPVFPTTRILPWKRTHLTAIKQVGNFVRDVSGTKT